LRGKVRTMEISLLGVVFVAARAAVGALESAKGFHHPVQKFNFIERSPPLFATVKSSRPSQQKWDQEKMIGLLQDIKDFIEFSLVANTSHHLSHEEDDSEEPTTSCDCPRASKTAVGSVCGESGRSHLSACLAKCSGDLVACNGDCPCPEDVVADEEEAEGLTDTMPALDPLGRPRLVPVPPGSRAGEASQELDVELVRVGSDEGQEAACVCMEV